MDNPWTRFWLALVFFGLCCLVFLELETRGAFGTELAAWVQAIGSIGAILGAGWIASRQFEESREREAIEKQARVTDELTRLQNQYAAAIAIGGKAITDLRAIATIGLGAGGKSLNQYAISIYSKAVDVVYEFPVLSLVDAEAIDKFCRLKSILSGFCEFVEIEGPALQNEQGADAHQRQVEGLLARIEDTCQLAERVLTKVAERTPRPC